MRYALIKTETGLVENVIELDETGSWVPPDGYLVIRSDSANIGDTYTDGAFITPPPPPPPVLSPEEMLQYNTQQQIGLLNAASQAMTPVLLSLQLGDATDTETLSAKAWQAYYRALQLVDLLLKIRCGLILRLNLQRRETVQNWLLECGE